MYVDEMLGALFVLLLAGVRFAYAIRSVTIGRAVDARIARETGTVLLGRFPIEAIHWAARAAGFFLVRRKVSPDTLTMCSLAITVVSLPLAATGHRLLAGCVFSWARPSIPSMGSSLGHVGSPAELERSSTRLSIATPMLRRSSGWSSFPSIGVVTRAGASCARRRNDGQLCEGQARSRGSRAPRLADAST